VTWCWRMSPLIVVALFAMRARWLVGLITRSAGRKATPAPSWALSLLRGSGSAVSQFFVWIYVALGVIFVLTVISGIVTWLIGEIKLQRECNQPLHFRAEPPGPKWDVPTRTRGLISGSGPHSPGSSGRHGDRTTGWR
jgi:lipid-A-disaccharide synthase-like uncharacterized protein